MDSDADFAMALHLQEEEENLRRQREREARERANRAAQSAPQEPPRRVGAPANLVRLTLDCMPACSFPNVSICVIVICSLSGGHGVSKKVLNIWAWSQK